MWSDNNSGANVQQGGRRTPGHQAAIAILIALAIGLATTPVQAAKAGRIFVVGPDEDAYRLSQTELLDADVRTALIDAASANPHEIDSVADANAVTVYIKDDAYTADIVAAVRSRFAGRSDVTISVSPAEVHRISFPPQVTAAANPNARTRDVLYLERFVRDARGEPQGIDLVRGINGVMVRISDPTRNAEIAEAMRYLFPKPGWQIASAPDHSWRITIDPAASNGAALAGSQFAGPALSPARRLLAPEAIEYELRDDLREPRDLQTNKSPDGLTVLIHDPARYPAFTATLRQAFSSNADFVYAVSPAKFLQVSLTTSDSRTNLARDASDGPNEALMKVWSQVNGVIDPPAPEIVIRPSSNGLEVRAKDASHSADVADTIRHYFTNKPNFIVGNQADQWLRVTFASSYLPSRIPEPGVLAENVRACLRTWNLDPSHVSIIGEKRIEVDLASDADAEKFGHSTFDHCGVMMRMVDKEAGKDPAEPPPSPGDERFPQTASAPFSLGPGVPSFPSTQMGALWLKPGVPVTADMIQEAHADVDQNGRPSISFKFNEEGRQNFAAITAANVGKRFAIVSDGLVISAPVIETPITGGSGEITGNFTTASAQAMATLILASKPQFPLKIIEERAVP